MARQDAISDAGGRIDQFEIVVTRAYFSIPEKYAAAGGGDRYFLHWLGTTDLEDRPILGEDDFHPSWKVGPGWESRDDGKTIFHERTAERLAKGKNRPSFGKPGGYGTMIDLVQELTEAAKDTPADPFYGTYKPEDASMWVGTKWYMESQKYGEGIYVKESLMPSKYLGRQIITAIPAPPQGNSQLRTQVEALARSSATFADFTAAALGIPGVRDDASLLMEIANQGGIWTSARS